MWCSVMYLLKAYRKNGGHSWSFSRLWPNSYWSCSTQVSFCSQLTCFLSLLCDAVYAGTVFTVNILSFSMYDRSSVTPVVCIFIFKSLHCLHSTVFFSAFGLVSGRASSLLSTCVDCSQETFGDGWLSESVVRLTSPCSSGKWPLKQRWCQL